MALHTYCWRHTVYIRGGEDDGLPMWETSAGTSEDGHGDARR